VVAPREPVPVLPVVLGEDGGIHEAHGRAAGNRRGRIKLRDGSWSDFNGQRCAWACLQAPVGIMGGEGCVRV
jgi:hypothetical protein